MKRCCLEMKIVSVKVQYKFKKKKKLANRTGTVGHLKCHCPIKHKDLI